MLIVFHDEIADMLSNKKLQQIVTGLIIRGRKLNISLVFVTLRLVRLIFFFIFRTRKVRTAVQLTLF